VKHIVQRAGFRSDEHLRLAFQKTFGKSPQAYRRRRWICLEACSETAAGRARRSARAVAGYETKRRARSDAPYQRSRSV